MPRLRIGPRFRYVAAFSGRTIGPPNCGGIVASTPIRIGDSVIGCAGVVGVGTVTPFAGFVML